MPREFSLECHLKSGPDIVRAAVMRPALFFHVAAPLISVRDIGERPIGEIWEEGEYRIALKLFGIIPIGWQAVVVDLSSDGGTALRDKGYGPMLREWDHRISVDATAQGGTVYTDKLKLNAGAFTPIAAFFVKRFFEPRQRRLKALDRTGFSDL